jgi:hypothetical protein
MLEAMEPHQPSSSTTDDNHQAIVQEISAYLSPTILTDDEKLSPLIVFWKHRAKTCPNLSKLARFFLTPHASSVPVESLFSITGLIKNARRSSIAPYRLNKVCFVHDNYDKFFPV